MADSSGEGGWIAGERRWKLPVTAGLKPVLHLSPRRPGLGGVLSRRSGAGCAGAGGRGGGIFSAWRGRIPAAPLSLGHLCGSRRGGAAASVPWQAWLYISR